MAPESSLMSGHVSWMRPHWSDGIIIWCLNHLLLSSSPVKMHQFHLHDDSACQLFFLIHLIFLFRALAALSLCPTSAVIVCCSVLRSRKDVKTPWRRLNCLTSGPRVSPQQCWQWRACCGGDGRAAEPDGAARHSAEGIDSGEGCNTSHQGWTAEGEQSWCSVSQGLVTV